MSQRIEDAFDVLRRGTASEPSDAAEARIRARIESTVGLTLPVAVAVAAPVAVAATMLSKLVAGASKLAWGTTAAKALVIATGVSVGVSVGVGVGVSIGVGVGSMAGKPTAARLASSSARTSSATTPAEAVELAPAASAPSPEPTIEAVGPAEDPAPSPAAPPPLTLRTLRALRGPQADGPAAAPATVRARGARVTQRAEPNPEPSLDETASFPATRAVRHEEPPPVDCAEAGELTVLQNALDAYDEGRPQEALRALDRQRAACPTGEWPKESWRLRIMSLCSLGQAREARAFMQWYWTEHPAEARGIASTVEPVCSADVVGPPVEAP